MRRTVLFTPGNRPERITKAWANGAADVVVADLEDAVPPAQKEAARQAVAAALATEGPCERAVRIQPWPTTAAEADLDAILPGAPDMIVVPKAEDPEALEALEQRVAHAEAALGLEPGRIGFLAIIETALGVLRAQAIASCPRVVAIAFGAEDLAADAGMRRTPGNDEVAVPRSLVALTAAAVGVDAIDMITADFRDEDRTMREAREARNLGYAGKMCLHPAQVAVVRQAFAPTAEEISWAKKVDAAASAAGAGAGGVVVVDGKMVDVPLVQQARRILRDANDES